MKLIFKDKKARLGLGLLTILALALLPITGALAHHRVEDPKKPENPPCDANHSYRSKAKPGKCGTEGPPGDENCSDGVDNDGDGKTDAADEDCQAPPPGTEGPPGDPTCEDGLDNDGDGKTDAADEDCQAPPPGTEGPPGDATCSDGLDNDGDGQVDQADSDCQEPEGPAGDPTCSDGVDNDGDGLTDEDDPDCAADTPCDDSTAITAVLPANPDGEEDGLQLIGGGLASGDIHDLEPLVPDDDGLGLGINPRNEVHTVNCRLVVPVEDLVESI